MFEKIKSKSWNMFWVYVAVLGPMWAMFFINNVAFNNAFSQVGGVFPRTFSFSGLTGIWTSWMFHANWEHIVGNTQILLTLLFFVGLIEKNPLVMIGSLITVSGIFTWLLGAPNTMHIGASGLVFAMMGYLFASIVLARRWLYIVALFFMGADYFYCMKTGLIPQGSISFAAHFGGLIGGIVVAYMIGKMNKKKETTDNMSLAM